MPQRHGLVLAKSMTSSHAAIGLSDMRPARQQDMVDKQRVSLVGMTEGGQQQAPEAGNRDVTEARARLI